jgi:hypothetical protein
MVALGKDSDWLYLIRPVWGLVIKARLLSRSRRAFSFCFRFATPVLFVTLT